MSELLGKLQNSYISRGITLAGFSGQFLFKFLKLFIFRFVVAICDLVHDVEAIFHLP